MASNTICLFRRSIYATRESTCFQLSKLPLTYVCTRSHSTSPYGRSHIRKKHPRTLPAPVVPHFLQHVTRADGSTFTHWTTSPRSKIILTRDTTNHPLWNATERVSGASSENSQDEEEEGTGRMTRFKKRFGEDIAMDQWLELQANVEGEREPAMAKERPTKAGGAKKK